MEGESTTALLGGFVFGALAFHHLNSGSDTEGFLLGEVKGEAKNSITDSQMDDVEVVYTIDIQKHIPCYRLSSFYSSLGELNKPALKKLLACHRKNVIGWYRFRHNTDQTMTYRERLLHKNLQEQLSNPGLVFLLLTSSSTTETKSTHRMEYSLHKPQDSVFQRVPLVVSNLGMSEQQGYKTVSGSCVSIGFSQAVNKHRSHFFHEDDTLKEVNKINNLYLSLQEELKKTCSSVLESERSVEKLLQEVNDIKNQIAEKKRQLCLKSGEEHTANELPENVLLCEALHKFFPSSVLLQTCRLSATGRPIPHSCSVNHDLHQADKLTLMISQSDFVETRARRTKKRKAMAIQDGAQAVKKTRFLHLRKTRSLRGEGETSDSEKLPLTSGTETDDDICDSLKMECSVPQSPTF
ncbi:BRCA1-A complex subunit Abraxas 1 [Spea bombifrons]|uniref:BRCA1-A complex subunit Abraxas 1 n=1 Tax=Spea bombifrons TaxID=233779 RepID=UPI00234B3C33|nr:BRCA1-A complex subunit Abraxas 1 [Spea bombifrons]